MKKIATILLLVVALASIFVSAAAASDSQVRANLVPVGKSGVSGIVNLTQLPQGGTHISVNARGLQPGSQHVSLYYHNAVCDIEPYSGSDIIGGRAYTANANGVGRIEGDADDDLDEIGSVSVRDANFNLLACARVHK